jgi:hypothetical protein
LICAAADAARVADAVHQAFPECRTLVDEVGAGPTLSVGTTAETEELLW